jgi:hypothetical protein
VKDEMRIKANLYFFVKEELLLHKHQQQHEDATKKPSVNEVSCFHNELHYTLSSIKFPQTPSHSFQLITHPLILHSFNFPSLLLLLEQIHALPGETGVRERCE